MEMWYIQFFGRKDLGTGILRNNTNGGDGTRSYKHRPETIEKLRITNQKPELMALRRSYRHTPEQIEKQRAAQMGHVGHMTGKKHSAETKDKMSLAQKNRTDRNFEFIRQVGYANKGRVHSEESRKNMSEGQKRRFEKLKQVAKEIT
jgi:hypothetical protein